MNILAFFRNLCFILLVCFLPTACHDDDKPVSNDDIIKLRIYNAAGEEISEIIGDGQTVITLEVTIPKNAGDSYSTVTFKKSAGEFIGSSDDNIVKPIDNDGKARVNLKVPLSGEPVFISAEIGNGNTLFIDEEILHLTNPGQVIKLEVLNVEGQELNGGIKADGMTILLLKATILTNTQEFNQIKFTTSNGSFQNNNSQETTKNTNNLHEAIVSLKVPKDVGPLYFSSAVGSDGQYFDEQSLILERARPDALIIEPAVITMSATQGNLITVSMIRNEGFVSTGTSATFKAFQHIGGNEVEIGRFTGLGNAVCDANGKIAVTFYADTNDITEDIPITIRVTAEKDDGTPIIGEIALMMTEE